MRRTGILYIISAPSGAGKTTLCNQLRETLQFVYSVSCTTRTPRKGEEEGLDYNFVSESTFQERVKQGYFIEHAKVHGNYYGTPLQPIKDALAKGKDLLLDIDVQGAAQIRNHPDPKIKTALVDIFMTTSTVQELDRRLRKRATDDEATIQRRLSAAKQEMSRWKEYSYIILSAKVEEDVDKFQIIARAESYKTSRLLMEGDLQTL